MDGVGHSAAKGFGQGVGREPGKQATGRFALAPRADLATYYEADVQRYAPDAPQRRVVTREVFMAHYQDCASIGFEHDGRPIGGILFDGLEAHIAVLPQYHGRWALLLKPALDWLFSLRERILVRVDPDNRRCIAFMEHHGWPCLGRVGDSLLYRITHQGGRRKTAYRFGQEQAGTQTPPATRTAPAGREAPAASLPA